MEDYEIKFMKSTYKLVVFLSVLGFSFGLTSLALIIAALWFYG